LITAAATGFAQGPEAPRYLMPPKEVVEAFDAPPLPQAILSPSKQVMALSWRTALSCVRGLPIGFPSSSAT